MLEKEARELIKKDPKLEKEENINIIRYYRPYARERLGWSKIA